MRVRDIMTQPVITVNEDTTLEEIAQIMLQHRIACVPVLNDNSKLVGTVTESIFTAKEKWLPFAGMSLTELFGTLLGKEQVDSVYEGARKIKAREIMNTAVLTVSEEDLVREVLEKMLRHSVGHILVVRDGLLVGIVARHDLLKMMLERENQRESSR